MKKKVLKDEWMQSYKVAPILFLLCFCFVLFVVVEVEVEVEVEVVMAVVVLLLLHGSWKMEERRE